MIDIHQGYQRGNGQALTRRASRCLSPRCLGVVLTCSLLSLCQACKKDGEPAAPSPTAGAILADPWFENVARAAGLDVVHLSAHDQRFLCPGSESAGV